LVPTSTNTLIPPTTQPPRPVTPTSTSVNPPPTPPNSP
jgi:hypothetical protein